MNICDKCGMPVARKDSALWLAVTAGEVKAPGLFVFDERHIRCSPSRAQYIPSFNVVDDRPEYDKRLLQPAERLAREALWTAAFNQLQNEK